MAANGNGTSGDTTTVDACMSDDITHRLQDLAVSTSDASPVGAMSIQPTPSPAALSPAPTPPANNAVTLQVSVQSRAVTSSCSKGWGSSSSSTKTMAARLDRLRRRRLFDLARRLPPPSVASITDELQNLTAGSAAFRPTALELVGSFLRPRIAGRPLPRAARFIHDADVYAAAPDHLAATHAPAPPGPAAAGGRANKHVWYFFSPLHYYQPDRNRKTAPCRRVVGGSGTWKTPGGRGRLAEEGEAANWYVMGFSYYELRHSGSSESKTKKSLPTEWRMREYGIAQQDGGRLQPLVLCEVFRSP